MKQKSRETLEFLYRTSIEARNFEIIQLVNRNNFFMIFQGVLFAGLAQASEKAPPVVVFIICAIGVIISLMQAAMASGAKFWQERWEYQVEQVEKLLLSKLQKGTHLADSIEPLFSMPVARSEKIVYERLNVDPELPDTLVHRFSVSRIPIFVGYIFSIAWLALLLCTIEGPSGRLVPSCIVGFPK